MNALLLIDLQIDFLAANGLLPVGATKAERVIVVANRMVELFEERHWPIIVIFNQFHDAPHFPKTKSSAFTNPAFTDYLQKGGIDNVIICGVYTEGCVRATAFGALGASLGTTVLSDGVASKRSATHKWALSNMQKRGVRVISSREYLDSCAERQER